MSGVQAPRRCLITGINGFAGPHLARQLTAAGTAVTGYTIDSGNTPGTSLPDAVQLNFGDIRDADRLTEVIARVQPDTVFHLAAISHVGQSWHRRRDTFDVNILGTEAVLTAVARSAPNAKTLLVSSGFVYGAGDPHGTPRTEQYATDPVSPYAVSKLCAELVGRQVARSSDLHVVTVRPFNFAGPGQGPTFVCADFARQVAWAEAGLLAPQIVVGNLEIRRDFTDVGDMVRGFVNAAVLGESAAVYNLCSGRGVRIQTILDTLVHLADCPIEVKTDANRLRPIDVPSFVGDPALARMHLNWQTRIPLRDTLARTLKYWREQAAVARVRQTDA